MTDETRTAAGSPSRREFLYAAGAAAAAAALPARAAVEPARRTRYALVGSVRCV